MKNILVNGVFDILHKGHLELLEFAAKQGDILTVLIDCDYRVTNSKGKSRPLNDHNFRKKLLESLKYVNKVIIFETDYQLEQYIIQQMPCIMVKGEEYKGKKIIGAEHCEEIIFFPIVEGYSTTEMIKKITKK
jgi:D-beta-D-heptose 7-phosphate kinase/D-beta-D-heptose 1-phosphate adenosyltransferase